MYISSPLLSLSPSLSLSLSFIVVQLESPIQQDFELLEKFPATLSQLQTDLKQAMDKMEEVQHII